MDDLFGMMYGDLEPAKKLLTSVTNNMVDSLTKLINEGIDVNVVVQVQNGNCALHIAAQKGHHNCMDILLKSGANPDTLNQFGFTPLAMALRHGSVECVRMLLQTGSMLSNPQLIWTSQQMDELPLWLAYTTKVIKLLILATPSVDKVDEENNTLLIKDRLFETKISAIPDVELIKLYFMSGNTLPANLMSRLLTRTDAELTKWIKSYPLERTLQEQARVTIRRQLHPNTLSGATGLPIPPRLQRYIFFDEEF